MRQKTIYMALYDPLCLILLVPLMGVQVLIVTMCSPSARGGHGVAAGIAEMIVNNSSLGITRISVFKNISPDRQLHGSARWSRACQLAAQSPRGEFLAAHAATRGKMDIN
jgi:hypothetical protein